MMDSPDVQIGDVPVKHGHVIRALLQTWKGRKYLDLRLWYDDGGEYKPTKKGIRIGADLTEELVELLEKADVAAYGKGESQ